MFFVGEYAHMITASALMVAMFFGGWHVWGGPGPEDTSIGAACIKFAIFWTKVALFIGFYMVIRWTIPRFRYDQLMRLAWKSLVPLGMGAVVVTGLLVTFGWQSWSAPVRVATALAANGLLLAAALATGANARTPVTGRQESLPPVPNESAGRPPRAGVKLT
jgi:NADH-quinone oxidoreductase subunit H